MPLLTVLIDTHNHESFIEKSVLSAVEQDFSHSDYEILVVDDGSTDRTAEIVRKFAPRVRLLRKKNGGQASAFNLGIREAQGDAVAFLDGDDWFAKGKLAAVAGALERQPEAFAVGHGYYEFFEKDGGTKVFVPEKENLVAARDAETAREACREWRWFLMGALTVRRRLLEKLLPISEMLIYCADTPIQRAAAAMGTYVLKEPLFYYRQHEGNHGFYQYTVGLESAKAASEKRRSALKLHEESWRESERELLALGAKPEVIGQLVYMPWVAESREYLRQYGGSRTELLETETRSFHAEHARAGALRRSAHHASVGLAARVLPPRVFYGWRNWWRTRLWFPLLDATRPMRRRLG